MSRQKSTPKRRRLTKLEGNSKMVMAEISINGLLDDTTIQPHLQDAVKVILEKDIDFICIAPVYANGKGKLVAHSNWLTDIRGIPRNLTVIVENGVLVEAIPENQNTWRMRYGRITYHGFAREKSIAYLKIKQAAIREMLGARS